MRHLHNQWLFENREGGGCTIEFTVDFSFHNRIFEALAGAYFGTAIGKMTDAFVRRADQLYGAVGKSS